MPEGITETPNGQTPQGSQLNTAVADAQEAVEEQESSLEELKARLTSSGRNTKALNTRLANLEKDLASLKEAKENADKMLKDYQDFVYTGKQASVEDQRAYATRQAAQAAAVRANSTNTAALWQTIAEEEDPQIRSRLMKIAKSDPTTHPTPRQIAALRESLVDVEPGDEPKKRPANVTGTSGGGTSESSLQSKLEEAKKKGDGDEVFRILSQIAAVNQRVSRG